MSKENNTQANVSQAVLGASDKGRVSYEVNGETVNLSFQIVRNFLTRGNAAVSDAEVIQFISLCRANQLNPFIGDAYMVKYQPRDGRPAEPAQMIISKSAFMKRGESAPQFIGYQAGIILLRDKQVVEEEGSFFLPGDELVGGWAKVYRKDRQHPIVARVRLQEYNKGKSTWAAMPGTMIRKVAIAQAFREAFPFAVDGMYTPEEIPDEQQLPEHNGEANKAIPQFHEKGQIDAPAPDQVSDPEPPEFTADPEPVQQPDPEPAPEKAVKKEKQHIRAGGAPTPYDVCDKYCREKNCDYCLGTHGQPCDDAKKRAGYVEPESDRLPWENGEPDQEAGSHDENLDLFKA